MTIIPSRQGSQKDYDKQVYENGHEINIDDYIDREIERMERYTYELEKQKKKGQEID